MLVCNKCFYSDCKCINSRLIEIDDLMVETIKLLNNKGYETLFCCSGHKEEEYLNTYIMFKHCYLFNDFEEYVIDSKYDYEVKYSGALVNLRTTIRFNYNYKDSIDKEVFIREVNEDLYHWANDLISLKEHEKEFMTEYSHERDKDKELKYSSYFRIRS